MKFLSRIVSQSPWCILLLPSPSAEAAVASPALQKEFDGFIANLAALKANDFAAVAGMTRLPFMGSVRDVAQFREKVYKPTSR